MYVEFKLPQNSSYGYVLELIKVEIVDWATKYNIPYTQKTIKYTHRLGFNNDKHFSLFSMTWKSEIPFQIINIANEKY
jgi:hypothetical protein